MARDWQDLFIVDGDSPSAGETDPAPEEQRLGRFRRLRENARLPDGPSGWPAVRPRRGKGMRNGRRAAWR